MMTPFQPSVTARKVSISYAVHKGIQSKCFITVGKAEALLCRD
ncbi:uncharacterized protein METZ01_LOCUS30088 [marine metagenome]|uniref:Uncharacterized protein n=1 Tax=marine metagenome TaxID=408172 RepID=A0A381QED0_9ZZZZ